MRIKPYFLIAPLLGSLCLTAEAADPIITDTIPPQIVPAIAGGYPSYADGLLTIPRIDTAERAGSFQDAQLQFDPQSGHWRLLEFKATANETFREFSSDNVELIMTDTSPTQVFLKIQTFAGNGCEQLGQVNQRLTDQHIEVTLTLVNPLANEPVACTMALVPLETIVPLQVYGLSAGAYEYSVNGQTVGSFTLARDNHL
ncbi:MAG: hypothetical protein Kow0065_18080 [Methylomicrobium sp.]